MEAREESAIIKTSTQVKANQKVVLNFHKLNCLCGQVYFISVSYQAQSKSFGYFCTIIDRKNYVYTRIQKDAKRHHTKNSATFTYEVTRKN
eukprot:c16902_g1_i1 orf=606-878(+)